VLATPRTVTLERVTILQLVEVATALKWEPFYYVWRW